MTLPEIITHLRESARTCENAANLFEQLIQGTSQKIGNDPKVVTMSSAGRNKIAQAQKRRWAKQKAVQVG